MSTTSATASLRDIPAATRSDTRAASPSSSRPEDVRAALLARVGKDNSQSEYYLVDVVNIANRDGRTCAVVVTDDEDEVAGINSRAELAEAEGRRPALVGNDDRESC